MERMVRHTTWIWLGKVLLASVIAFGILTLLSMLYYKLPAHSSCPDGATDYCWQADYRLIQASEGVGWGRTNNEGYVNTFDYHAGDRIDTLIMGSSHMEGFHVPAKDKVPAILSGLMQGETVYNIGIAKHVFLSCAQNLRAAVQKYSPKRCVVIETYEIQFPDREIAQALSGDYAELPSYEGSILGLLERIPYLRLINRQRYLYMVHQAQDDGGIATPSSESDAVQGEKTNDPVLLGSLLSRMEQTVSDAGTELIIVYHPAVTLNKDGSLQFATSVNEEDSFAALCEENGILFLNMRDRFQSEYDESHVLPYGFANSAVGYGHLNRYGHRMMAEELYALMQEAIS